MESQAVKTAFSFFDMALGMQRDYFELASRSMRTATAPLRALQTSFWAPPPAGPGHASVGHASVGHTSVGRAVVPYGKVEPVDGGEKVIALGEETFHVDKKRIEGETTTVHRYVVETPVAADVQLVAKSVTIERRKPTGMDAVGTVLTEQTISAKDSTEVPVVSKGVRVVEEVVLREEETLTVKTVHGTIKHDSVRIEQPHRSLVPVKADDKPAKREVKFPAG